LALGHNTFVAEARRLKIHILEPWKLQELPAALVGQEQVQKILQQRLLTLRALVDPACIGTRKDQSQAGPQDLKDSDRPRTCEVARLLQEARVPLVEDARVNRGRGPMGGKDAIHHGVVLVMSVRGCLYHQQPGQDRRHLADAALDVCKPITIASDTGTTA
jgi:hypothetical protein